MYIAVCDDQQEELQLLVQLLKSWQSERRAPVHFKTYRNATQLLDDAKRERFSLYLLDVMMPGTDGITAAREIRTFDETAEIVFLTSSPGFAYESYRVRAMDYLLKPIHTQALFPVLDKLYLREQKPREGFALKVGATRVRILYSQLTHVEINGKHLYFYLSDGTVHQVYGALNEYAPLLLCRPEFMKVHRSYIVNMYQVSAFSPGSVRTFSGKDIPVSRMLYQQLQKEYMQLLFSGEEEPV